MNSFIPWVGGKGKLLWIINKLMPDRYTRFIDVFGGSGTVTMCRPIQRGCMEVYNDFNDNLTNLFCCVKNRPMALLAELGFLPLNTRDDFNVLYKFFSKGEFTDDYLQEEMDLTEVYLKPPDAEAIRALMLERAPRGSIRRAADFFKLIRYSFSGGAKCILPGVSSLRTIMRNHSFTTTTEFNMGNPHTLMRSDAEQAARMMGLDFKIDAILNGHAQICNLFAGDFEAEIQHAAAYAAEHYAAKFVPDCDVVIANNYFKPAEANCAYTPEVIASLKDGGSFVLAANSPFGPCVHFLYDKWGHSAPGGMMWSGCYTKGKNMAHAVVFAEHTVKGMRDPWYIDEHSGAEYVKTWSDAVRILDDGTPKKVVLYPNAECQVLDNSKQFYKQGK